MNFPRRLFILLHLLLALLPVLSQAQSTISPAAPFAWAANAGWITLRPTTADGVAAGEFICQGHAWAANLGWLNLGDGAPANGIRYSNTDGSDSGVNVMPGGRLRGLAWGGNIGWVQFHDTGDPRIDLTSGRLRGHAYGINIGWINLGEQGLLTALQNLLPAADTDQDQLPDAWEREHSGGLQTLSGLSQHDADHDSQSDLSEYQSGTHPILVTDRFQTSVSTLTALPNGDRQLTLTWPSHPTRLYRLRTSPDLRTWQDSGLGLLSPNPSASTTTLTWTFPATSRLFLQTEAMLPGGW